MEKPFIHGFYSTIRDLANSIKADVQHLEAAPLGPKQKKKLAESITYQKAKLKEARIRLKEYKRLHGQP